MNSPNRRAFTLIELLVVIAIIAILAVVVILTLNPAELLRQSRDANRLSDLATINSAMSIYNTDQTGSATFNIGSASTTYVSIPDPSATSTAGDQCQGLGLPALSAGAGYVYHCAASSSFRTVGGTGWIPTNLSSISSGAPIGVLPIDAINQTSSNFFYTYTTDGSKYELTTIFESQKYRSQFSTNAPIPGSPEVAALGSSLLISELYSPTGLLGYWPLDEGSGTLVTDISGTGNNGTWSGTGPYYGGAKVGTYSGIFNVNGTTKVSLTPPASLTGSTAKSILLWLNASVLRSNEEDVAEFGTNSDYQMFGVGVNGSNQIFAHFGGAGDFASVITPSPGTWYNVALTYNGSLALLYINGLLSASNTETANTGNTVFYFGQHPTASTNYFVGSIDDVHLYNRVISPAEILSLYNAEK